VRDIGFIEPVSYDGKSKSPDNYGWSPRSTRIVYLINSHLQYSIETAMKNALATANKSIVGGLEAAVKIALQDAQAKIKVTASI